MALDIDNKAGNDRFSASFRVLESSETYEDLSKLIPPSHMHRAGEIRNPKTGATWDNSIWMLTSPLPKSEHLTAHLEWLWERMEPFTEILLKKFYSGIKMDFFCSYTAQNDNAGFSVEPKLYGILAAMPIPLGFSIICL